MKRASKLLIVSGLLVFLLLSVTLPARAFDGRAGGRVVVPEGEVIDDDLYVAAATLVMDGTVNGDLIAIGRTITIDGVVEGDVIAVGQTVQVNGAVTGAIRAAGAVLLLNERGSSGGDLVAAGYSLETRPGSEIGKDLLFAGGQVLLAGEVHRHAHVSAGAFELRGAVNGSVSAGVGEAAARSTPFSPARFIPSAALSIPAVAPGLALAPGARVAGDLAYRQSRELAFPAGAVAGEVVPTPPGAGPAAAGQEPAGGRLLRWGADLLRASLTLILAGLFLLWLSPRWIQGMGRQLQVEVWPSLGWGAAAVAIFFLLLLLVLLAAGLGGLLFGVISLGGLAGAVIAVGALALLALSLGFVLATSFLAKLVFGQALGRWLLARARSPLAEHRFWPLAIGVVILAAVLALLRLPPIPGFVGSLLNLAVTLSGLGALWLWVDERIARRRTLAQEGVS